MADKLLEVKGVSKIFRVGGMLRGKKLVAVDNVSLSIDNDKPVILSIVGESGCGKSTLCKMILRLHNPDMGDIVMDGKSYADKKSYDPKQFKLDVQPIFQNPYESFSARKTVDTYLYNTALRLGIAKNRAEADKVVDEALKSVGMSLAVVKGKYATQFSGGELQRVSIARALITRPKLIIADEPVAAIDASMKMNIVNLFKELRDKYKISFIYITHDLSTAYYVSDYIATLYRGCLIEYGPETNGKKKLSCRIWKEKNMQWNTVSSHLVVRTQPMNVVRNARMQKIWAMAVWFFAVTLCVSRQKKRKISL